MPSLWLNLDSSENVCTSDYQITATARPIYGENAVSAKIEFTQCAIDAENTPVLATATVNATQNPPVMEFGTSESMDTTGTTLDVPSSGVSGIVQLVSRMDGTDYYNLLYGSVYSENVLVGMSAGTAQGEVNYSVPEVPFTNPDTDYYTGARRGSGFVYQKTTSKYYAIVAKQESVGYTPENVFVFNATVASGGNNIDLSNDDLEEEITVVSTKDGDFYGYEAIPDSTWFDCIVDDGTATVVTVPLSGADDRSGTLVLRQKTSGHEVVFNIAQYAQKEYVFNISGSTGHTIDVVSGRNTTTVDIVSTLNGGFIGFTYEEVPDWVSVTISGNGTVAITVEENPEVEIRNTVITFVQDGSGNEVLLTINQAEGLSPDAYVFEVLGGRSLSPSFLTFREYVWRVPVVSTCNGAPQNFTVEKVNESEGFSVEYLGKDSDNWLSFKVNNVDTVLSSVLSSRFSLTQNDSNNNIPIYFTSTWTTVDGTNGIPKRMLFVGGMTYLYLDATEGTIFDYDLLAGYYDDDGNLRSDYTFSYEIVNEIPFLNVQQITEPNNTFIRITVTDSSHTYDTNGIIMRTNMSGDMFPAYVGIIVKGRYRSL